MEMFALLKAIRSVFNDYGSLRTASLVFGLLISLLALHFFYYESFPFNSTDALTDRAKGSQKYIWKPCPWWASPKDAGPSQKSNGYIIVDCTGGLNQMRRDFCDGVAVARLLNATLLLPQFETSSYWNDSSGFADIFDVDYFIQEMREVIQIVKELPKDLYSKQPPVVNCIKKKSFDYVESLLPILLKNRVIIIRPAASQRADRYSLLAKAARCQACYKALRLVPYLEEQATLILKKLPRPFVALHLRFEPDMIAFSRCVYSNLSEGSIVAIEAARESNREAFTGDLAIAWRKRGKCPLTPDETAFMLQALRLPIAIPVYLASGSGLLEMDKFTSVYKNTYTKYDILDSETLKRLHGNSKAAIDYYIAVNSDIYIATYFGNMDKMVVAVRVLQGKGGTVVLNRRDFSESVMHGLTKNELMSRVWKIHEPSLTSGKNLPLPDCFCNA